MQELHVAARLYPLILSGGKTAIIRWREARILPGPLTCLCAGGPGKQTVVMVTTCTDMPLSQAAAFLGREADWPDAVLLEGMRAHYPGIQLTDMVQVIEHRNEKT